MKYKLWAAAFTVLGFLASVGFPVWAVLSQMAILRTACETSVFEKFDLAIGGIAVIVFIVALTVIRYVSAIFKEKFRPQRTLFSFFVVGYVMIITIRYMIASLEIIFLGGSIGAMIAVVCYFIADQLKEKGKK